MTANLPAYLQGKPTTRRLVETAATGIGSALPPHISIRGNSFTLVDASKQEQDVGATMDACIVDISDVVAKRYMDPDKPWTPDSNDPPLCWSSNGIGPSTESSQPQSPTCGECQWNVRGSAVSKISGAAIKACRDEKYLVLLLPQFPAMMWRLVLTPGSFQNWVLYLEKFKGQQFDIDDVITRFAFQPKVNGVMTFNGVSHIGADFVGARNAALGDQGKRDTLAGRNDRPRGGTALPPPALSGGHLTYSAAPTGGLADSTAPAQQPTQQQTAAPFGEPQGEAAATPKRRGRPKSAEGGQAASSEPVTAPFRPAASPVGNGASPAAGGFGIAPGVAPNPEISAALDSMFGPTGT